MDKYKRYYGLCILLVVLIAIVFVSMNLIKPTLTELDDAKIKLEKKEKLLKSKQQAWKVIGAKLQKLKDSAISSQKKIYAPEISSDDDSLFFSLYTDVIEMVNSNGIKIKSIDYSYNPASDPFVEHGKDAYFVCDINIKLVSNYVNLGKLIQDIYQYPYYIKINELDVKPYAKDKKILLSKMSLRLYSKTEPDDKI